MLNAVCRQKYESFVVVLVQVSRSASLNGPWSEPVGPLVERGGAKLLLLAPRHLLIIASFNMQSATLRFKASTSGITS